MYTKEEITTKIKELGKWYQRVNLDGIFTTKSNRSDERVWKDIRSLGVKLTRKEIVRE